MVSAALVLEDIVVELVKGVPIESVGARGGCAMLAVKLPPLIIVDQRLVGPKWKEEYCLASMNIFCAAGSGFLSGWYFWAMVR